MEPRHPACFETYGFEMNPNLTKLQLYPFEKLATLNMGVVPPKEMAPIVMSIGEPKHPAPQFILDAIKNNMAGYSNYPVTIGMPQLREAITQWLTKRFKLKSNSLNIDRHVLPVNGTREALFAFAQCVVDPNSKPFVFIPNPFYQIYEGAAFLAGAEPVFLNIQSNKKLIPDFDSVKEDEWKKCQLLYLCSPGNPTGAVIDKKTLQKLIELSIKHNFVIASDECYSEIYFDEDHPPTGLLEAAEQMGIDDFQNCVVFHSLSKRSSVPGLRSGFVAGDAKILEKFRLYRTYHGCAMPPPTQFASLAAWQDEKHVVENRALYREKFEAGHKILSSAMEVEQPQGGFYFWLKTPSDDCTFARNLYEQKNVTVLPGSFLSREFNGSNPGYGYVRMALVPPLDECVEAARRLTDFVKGK
jgi:N-succinyldiaminopimelate aminotransferase